MGLSACVCFSRARNVGRWGHPGSLGVLVRRIRVVDFILNRKFHSYASCVSLGSSAVVLFTRAPCGRCVHTGSLGSLECALVVVGFIRGHWVHSRTPWGSLWSSVVVVFARALPGGR